MTRILLVSLLLSLSAWAAPSNTDKARAAFQAAQQLYGNSRYADALKKFQEALALKPHPVIVFNIARCHEQLGNVPEALKAYRDYLAQVPNATDKDAVKQSIAILEVKLGPQPVVIAVEPARSVVKVDGRVISGTPPTVELLNGEHTLEVTAAGYETWNRTFTMSGKPLEMNVALRALAVADAPKKDPSLVPTKAETPLVTAPAAEPRRRTGTWITAGVAVVAAGTAAGLGGGALGTKAKLVDGTERPRTEADQLAKDANGMALGSNIAWGVAGAAAVTAVILFFVEGAP